MDTPTTPTTKRCTKCGEVKLFSEFGKESKGKYGLRALCNACRAVERTARYKANREKEIAQRRAYYEANREKQAAQTHAHYMANREEKQAQSRGLREALVPSYVASQLGISTKDLTPDLYALKREQILNHRTLQQFNEVLKGLSNDKRSDTERADDSDLDGVSGIDQRRRAPTDLGDHGGAQSWGDGPADGAGDCRVDESAERLDLC